MANQPTFTWTVAAGGAGGSVSSSGLYTAPLANGSDTVIATDSSANLSGTAAVTVLVTPPEVLSAASASANPVTGTTANLSVFGNDPAGESSLTYTWAVTSALPAPPRRPTFRAATAATPPRTPPPPSTSPALTPSRSPSPNRRV